MSASFVDIDNQIVKDVVGFLPTSFLLTFIKPGIKSKETQEMKRPKNEGYIKISKFLRIF